MAYNRQPNVVLAGQGLKQNPLSNTTTPSGIIPVLIDAETATTTQLGVVQVGSGLSITPLGVLSAASTTNIYSVKLTKVNYTVLADDYYIGATESGITITLPLGITGKTYAIKNQDNGTITVKPTGSQKIDGSSSQSLATNKAIIVIFDGTQWQIISSI
jgi:hypothetical protein